MSVAAGSVVVGVHGVAQQQLGRRQLLRAWGPALTDGLELAFGRPVVEPSFDLAFYGNLFLPPSEPGQKGGSTEPHEVLADLSDAEMDELLDVAREAVTPEELAAAEAGPPKKAYVRVPKPLQAVLRALDARFGAAAGVLYLGVLRQVRHYLVLPDLKAEVDGIVDRATTPTCRVLIGHSLGSVVALEYLRRHPEHRLDLFLTLGSPLGLRMVRSRLPDPLPGADTSAGVPGNVARWINVRDPRDPVACAGDLVRLWPGVQDRHVDNEADAHNVSRYLSKVETGSAILGAEPRLGVPEER
ncbi:alpha/beta fold hydrolase domain-containing protein [Pseudonocardia charpentierae]|uniref:Alpha/beta hydrolase n=1 Tax=Pseudonocardia charpentierae TaxID=3075545 RepID=A0ABU2NHD8_9PSEU|nr:hypothetical protein [Pseudonocardia sp. DSM 45834]MDT0353377.1 hypothetical protein [Pseudonocardia sp. DSM 45834]